MKIQRILLINVGNDPGVSEIPNDGTFPALGVVSLATHVLRLYPHLEVLVLDGQVSAMAHLEARISDFRPDVLGLSVLGVSYGNSLRLAEVGKNNGALVVLGNDQAAIMADQIIRRREFVDFVCTADVGEFSFAALIAALQGERPMSSVPRLVYRTPEGIRRNELEEMPSQFATPAVGGALGRSVLDAIPIPRRSLLPTETYSTYLRNYLRRYGALHSANEVTGVATMNRARGCARVKAPCHFCGIADLSLRFSSPEVFWADVRQGQEELQATVVYEAFDSMSSSPRWIETLVAAKPDDLPLEPHFFVYTQAIETTPRLVNLYRQLGVFRVNMGLESGDDRMLKVLKGPRDGLEKNRRACLLLKEAGFLIYGSLVLGGPGEDSESLSNTVSFAHWLIDNQMMAALEAQPLYPDLGALTGHWLMNPEMAHRAAQERGFEVLDPELLNLMPSKYGNTDVIDFDEISMDWARIFSRVSWDELAAAAREVRSYAEARGTTSGSTRISSVYVETTNSSDRRSGLT